MARNAAESCYMADPSTPQWMRELLIRRRALGRTLQVGSSSVKLTCPAVVAVVRQPEVFGQSENVASRHPVDDDLITTSSLLLCQTQGVEPRQTLSSGVVGESAFNMRLLDTNCVVLNGGDVRNKQSDMCVNHNLIMGEDKKVNLKKKSATSARARAKFTQNTGSSFNQKLSVESEKSNGNLNTDDDCMSDSSEELQYGPGIVNKLKTRYLSMTLREQKKKSRPSIINLRRATSLENMLEVDANINKIETKPSDTMQVKTENKQSEVNNRVTFVTRSVCPNSNRVMKYLGNRSSETMKRARSMETLLKTDLGQNTFKENVPVIKNKPISKNEHTKTTKAIAPIVNENIIIIENIPVCSENSRQDCPCDLTQKTLADGQIVTSSSSDSQDRELPPPDLVKQTLKIFEPSAKRRTKASNGSLSTFVAEFSTASSQSSSTSVANNRTVEKVKMSPNKPSISPKPVISPEKLRQNRSRVSSPKKVLNSSNCSMDNTHTVSYEDNPLTRLNNMNSLSHQTSIETLEINRIKALPIPNENDLPPIASANTLGINSSVPPLSNVALTACSEQSLQNSPPFEEKDNNLNEYDESDSPSIESSKPVLESSLENIRRGGFSVQFSFNKESPQNTSVPKTYLPIAKTPPQALNSSLLKQKLENSSPNIAPLRISSSPITGTKQIGIIRPLVSTKNQSSPTVVLTNQEIEKNLINRVKSIEQPISKVVVAVKALPDKVVLGSVSDSVRNQNSSLPRVSTNSKAKNQSLWDEEKIWQNSKNTIVFNFSDRKEVPDYIENDGLILRGKREKPRPGEGGIILLEGADTCEESCTDNEDFITSEPPSPCDVTFLNDNVLINGKSNLQKSPKQVKLRIKFDDDATTMFEYPSEASMVEEETAETANEVDINSEGATCQPSTLPPSTSSSALPGSMHLGVPPPDYLPPPVPVKTVQAKLLVELTVKPRAPQPPTFRPAVPARSPLRRSPSDPGTLKPQPIKLGPELPPSRDIFTTTFVSKKQKYFSKKKTRPRENIESTTLNPPSLEPSFKKKTPDTVHLQEISTNVLSYSENASHCFSEDDSSSLLVTSLDMKKDASNKKSSKQTIETFEKEKSFDSISDKKTTYISSSPNHVLQNSSVPRSQVSYVPTKVQKVVDQQSQQKVLKTVNSASSIQTFSFDVSSFKTIKPTKRNLQGKEPSRSNLDSKTNLLGIRSVQLPKPSLEASSMVESKLQSSNNDNFSSSIRGSCLPLKANVTKDDVDNLQIASLPYFQSSSILDHSNSKLNPMYSPVYSKPQSRLKTSTSSSELKVNALLSPSLCKKPYLGTGIIKAQKSAKKPILVLDGWPLGTESLV